MLNQRPALDITCSNWYQVRVHVDNDKSHLIVLARYNRAELFGLYRFASTAECLEFIHSFLADNQYLFPIAELVEDGVRGLNPI
jgi:hypothetical protein